MALIDERPVMLGLEGGTIRRLIYVDDPRLYDPKLQGIEIIDTQGRLVILTLYASSSLGVPEKQGVFYDTEKLP